MMCGVCIAITELAGTRNNDREVGRTTWVITEGLLLQWSINCHLITTLLLPSCSQWTERSQRAVTYRGGNSIGVLRSHLLQCSQRAVTYREDNSIGVLHSYLPQFSQWAVTYREGNSIGVLHSQCSQWAVTYRESNSTGVLHSHLPECSQRAVAYREGNSIGDFSLSSATVLTAGSHVQGR